MNETGIGLSLEYHPEEGPPSKYRVWNIINPPNPPNYFYVDSPETGKHLIEIFAIAQSCNPMIESNAFGFEELDEDGWSEWYDEDGNSIDECFKYLEM